MICTLAQRVDPSLIKLIPKILGNKYLEGREKMKQSSTIQSIISRGPSNAAQINYR